MTHLDIQMCKFSNVKYIQEILTFMESLSLLAKYRCLFSKHSTAERQKSVVKGLQVL